MFGTTTLPLDFDIFLWSGSRIQPDSVALAHGRQWFSRSARSIVLNSQVRMMSWPCGRKSIGNVDLKNRSFSSPGSAHFVTICGVSDDVAQVSMMSGSAMKPFGWSRWSSPYPSGTSMVGSIGRRSSLGVSGLL